MPTKTWVVGEEVLAADFNAYVQRQVIPTFANAAARDAAITAPTDGMHCYLQDLHQSQVYTTKPTTPGWYKPWNVPWGVVASGVVNDLTPQTGSQWAHQVVFPVAGRRYRYDYSQNMFASQTLTLTYLTQQGITPLTQGKMTINAAWWTRVALTEVASWGGDTTNNNHTIGVVVTTDAGTCSTGYGRFALYDVGPI